MILWEPIDSWSNEEGEYYILSRLKVPGGWLVKVSEKQVRGDEGISVSNSICFYPDTYSKWDISNV